MPEISLAHWPVCSREALGEVVLPWDSLDAQRCPVEPYLSKNSVALPWIRPSFVLGHGRGPSCPCPVASWRPPGRSGSLEAPNSEFLWNPFRRGMSRHGINASHHRILIWALPRPGLSTGLTATAAPGDLCCSSHLQSMSWWELILIPGRQVSWLSLHREAE